MPDYTALYLTRLQSDEVGSGSLESRESARVRMCHTDLAEHTGLLIWYTCWVHTFQIIRRKEMPAFSKENKDYNYIDLEITIWSIIKKKI